MASDNTLLSEIARKLRKLECICANTASTGGAIVQAYQPLDCNGDPIGTPIDVMATISVAKQDVAICNTDAIVGTYNVPFLASVENSATLALSADLGVDVTKLHSLTVTVLSGTVQISGDLGGGGPSASGIPAGVSLTWKASTVFGTGDVTFMTDGTGRILITAMSSL